MKVRNRSPVKEAELLNRSHHGKISYWKKQENEKNAAIFCHMIVVKKSHGQGFCSKVISIRDSSFRRAHSGLSTKKDGIISQSRFPIMRDRGFPEIIDWHQKGGVAWPKKSWRKHNRYVMVPVVKKGSYVNSKDNDSLLSFTLWPSIIF